MQTTDFERIDYLKILKVKEEAEARLCTIPGVHGVGIGAKIVRQQPTAEPSIMVFLVKKRPLDELAPSEVIPPEIDGVKTDVVEMSVPQALAYPEEKPDSASAWSLSGLSITLRGGLQIQAADSPVVGTLGCIATTSDPQHPKRVALTCHHVVALRIGQTPTQLSVEVSPDDPGPMQTLTFLGNNTPGSLVVTTLEVSAAQSVTFYNLLYVTNGNDSPITIARAVARAIGGLNNTAVHVTWPPNSNVVTVDVPPGSSVHTACKAFDPPTRGASSSLQSSVDGNAITITGHASKTHGIYTNFNQDVANSSYGVFTTASKGDSLDSIVSSITGRIDALISNLGLASVSTEIQGHQIIIHGAVETECTIVDDLRVGQPSDSFCSVCCPCCNDQIGHVVDARLDLDTALIELDSGVDSKPEILDIGVIKGVRPATDPAIAEQIISQSYPVQKRGLTTRHTKGRIAALNYFGKTTMQLPRGDGTTAKIFHRFYRNAILIQPDDAEQQRFRVNGDDILVFADAGDSGAALVNADNEIMGLVFSGTVRTVNNKNHLWGVATPIEAITSAFGLTIETATTVQEARTTAAAPLAAASYGRLREMEQEITSTPAGRTYAELVKRHFPEAQHLVNTNRRVATVWHRSGGPQIVQAVLDLAHRRDKPLPAEIDGKPLAACLERFKKVMARYASPALAADLARFSPRLESFAGFTYAELLSALQAGGAE